MYSVHLRCQPPVAATLPRRGGGTRSHRPPRAQPPGSGRAPSSRPDRFRDRAARRRGERRGAVDPGGHQACRRHTDGAVPSLRRQGGADRRGQGALLCRADRVLLQERPCPTTRGPTSSLAAAPISSSRSSAPATTESCSTRLQGRAYASGPSSATLEQAQAEHQWPRRATEALGQLIESVHGCLPPESDPVPPR